jgi:glycosyltransferase involved in cell wall biosynthesis
MNYKKNCILLQTAIGDYRQNVLDIIIKTLGDNFEIITGKEYFETSLKTSIKSSCNLKIINNLFFFNRRALWQQQALAPCIKTKVLIMEGNPRIISSWLILFVRKLFFKKTILWMHAWPRSGRNSKSDKIRHLLRKLADTIVVYTETQASDLKQIMPNTKIIAAPNAVISKLDMRSNPSVVPNSFFWCGRLVESKKPMLAINAFIQCMDQLPKDCYLYIAGDGPLKQKIEEIISSNGLESRIILLGHVSDSLRLANYYDNSIASISSGYVGLSITQSFSYGCPMIISRNENHAPEIEAAVENINCQFFETDNISSLSQVLINFYHQKHDWILKRDNIVTNCKNNYCVELMASRLLTAINHE